MTSLMQTKILRVLQDQQFERVGGNESIRTDVRLIAATNRDLEHMIKKGEFRGDLFYRLNVYTITRPPLREWGDDMAMLAEYFSRQFSNELGKELSGIATETIKILKQYSWPGNVRELQSVIKHAILEATGPILVPAFLPDAIRNFRNNAPAESKAVEAKSGETGTVETGATADHTGGIFPQTAAQSPSPRDSGYIVDRAHWVNFVSDRLQSGSQLVYDEALQDMERNVIPLVLQHTEGNQLRAAKLLGMSRATLRTKCRQYGITVDKIVDSGQ